jgi:predicted nucleic acid-binding protein
MNCVLDASAILRFTDDEAGADRIEAIFNDAAKGRSAVLISAVNWGEVVGVLHKRNRAAATRIADGLLGLPMTVMSVDAWTAESAGRFKHDLGMPFADAFAVALTLQASTGTKAKATLVTADFDFKSVPKDLIRVEFLPQK